MDHNEEKEIHQGSESAIQHEKRPYSISLPGDDAGKGEPIDADLGLRILQDRGDNGDYVLDPELKKRVLRKLDVRLMPLMTITTIFGFLELVTLNYSAVFGVLEHAHLDEKQFAWLGSIFYFGYLAMQPFVSRLLQIFKPAQTIAVMVFLWGAIVMLSVTCNSFSKFMAARFFLGATAACVNPAFILISGMFYPREDQPFRVGIWFSGNGWANIIGGILSFGLGHIHAGGLLPYMWIFIILGVLAILWSIVVFLFLPASQETARFLTEEEKVAAVEMVRDNNTGIHNKTFKWSQLREAFLDPKSYIFFFFAFWGNLANSIATFGSQIISHFGFNSLQTTLLGMPNGGVEVLCMIPLTYVCLRYRNIRCLIIILCNIIALVGSIVVFVLPFNNKAGLLVGYYMFTAWPTGYALSLALAASNTAGYTKKVVTNCFIMAGFCSSNIIGPQFFNKPPRYRLGIGSCIFTFAAMIVTSVIFQVYVMWLNKKNAASRDAARVALEGRVETGFEDLTDKENPLFEYVY